MPQNRRITLLIVGLGNIGRRFLQVLDRKADHVRARYGLTFTVVGATP